MQHACTQRWISCHASICLCLSRVYALRLLMYIHVCTMFTCACACMCMYMYETSCHARTRERSRSLLSIHFFSNQEPQMFIKQENTHVLARARTHVRTHTHTCRQANIHNQLRTFLTKKEACQDTCMHTRSEYPGSCAHRAAMDVRKQLAHESRRQRQPTRALLLARHHHVPAPR
jgi:hypothetical protein